MAERVGMALLMTPADAAGQAMVLGTDADHHSGHQTKETGVIRPEPGMAKNGLLPWFGTAWPIFATSATDLNRVAIY